MINFKNKNYSKESVAYMLGPRNCARNLSKITINTTNSKKLLLLNRWNKTIKLPLHIKTHLKK